MMMAIYGLDSDTAFEIIRSRSQTTNTKVHALAQQLVTEFAALGGALGAHSRAGYDHVFITCHKRVTK